MNYIIEAQNIKDTYKTILNRAKEFKEKGYIPLTKHPVLFFLKNHPQEQGFLLKKLPRIWVVRLTIYKVIFHRL